MEPNLRRELERRIPDSDIPALPAGAIRRRGQRIVWERRVTLSAAAVVTVLVLIGAWVALQDGNASLETGPAKVAPSEPPHEPSPSPSVRLIGDHVVSIHPERVRPGERAELRITDPPGSYGLAWELDRWDGSGWEWIGGYKAGPPDLWEGHKKDRFYFLPEVKKIGIESIGFEVPASTPIVIPQIPAGRYRIVGGFELERRTDDGDLVEEWHYGEFEVIE